MNGAEAGAIAEMRDDDALLRMIRRDGAQAVAYELIGEAVEPVPADTEIADLARKRERLGQMRLSLVERRVEAGDLRDVRRVRHDRFDRREVVRLVQRRKRAQRFQRCEHVLRHGCGRVELRTAVDDPVPDTFHSLAAEQ